MSSPSSHPNDVSEVASDTAKCNRLLNTIMPVISADHKLVLLTYEPLSDMNTPVPTEVTIKFDETNPGHKGNDALTAKVTFDSEKLICYKDEAMKKEYTSGSPDFKYSELTDGKTRQLYFMSTGKIEDKESIEGDYLVTLESDGSLDATFDIKPKNEGEFKLVVVGLELVVFQHLGAGSYEDDQDKKVAAARKLSEGRFIHFQANGIFKRAKVIVKKPNDLLWKDGREAVKVALKAEKADHVTALKFYNPENGDSSSDTLLLSQDDFQDGDKGVWVEVSGITERDEEVKPEGLNLAGDPLKKKYPDEELKKILKFPPKPEGGYSDKQKRDALALLQTRAATKIKLEDVTDDYIQAIPKFRNITNKIRERAWRSQGGQGKTPDDLPRQAGYTDQDLQALKKFTRNAEGKFTDQQRKEALKEKQAEAKNQLRLNDVNDQMVQNIPKYEEPFDEKDRLDAYHEARYGEQWKSLEEKTAKDVQIDPSYLQLSVDSLAGLGDIANLKAYSFDKEIDRATRNKCHERIRNARAGTISKGQLNNQDVAIAYAGLHETYHNFRNFRTEPHMNHNYPDTVFPGFIQALKEGTDTQAGTDYIVQHLDTVVTLHPVVKEMIKAHLDATVTTTKSFENKEGVVLEWGFNPFYGTPGVHAEVLAVNEVLNYLQDKKAKPKLDDETLGKITVATYKLQNYIGKRFTACGNCYGILNRNKLRIITENKIDIKPYARG